LKGCNVNYVITAKLATFQLYNITTNNKMKNSEILELSTEELVARVGEERTNLTKLKFAHAVSAIENPIRITRVRKDIARLNTELTKRKAASASE
jgi:large subunit ribosomal protein L29